MENAGPLGCLLTMVLHSVSTSGTCRGFKLFDFEKMYWFMQVAEPSGCGKTQFSMMMSVGTCYAGCRALRLCEDFVQYDDECGNLLCRLQGPQAVGRLSSV